MVIPNVMNTVNWDGLFVSIRDVIRSVADKSYIIMGLFLIVSIVVSIANHYFKHMFDIDKGVKKRSLSRQIFRADVDRNVNDIIFNKNLEREVNLRADERFYSSHRKSLIDASLRKKELGLDVDKIFNEKNRKALIDSQLHKKELGLEVTEIFEEKNFDSLVDAAVRKKVINHEADLLFHDMYPDAYDEKRAYYEKKNAEYYKHRKGKK